MSDPVNAPIAYLTGEYPRATDSFIQREVAALRAFGLTVETCSIRRTAREHHVGAEQRKEAARTFHVLEAAANPLTALRAHARALWRAPARYLRALALAWRTSPGGIGAHLYQLIYFAEAVVLADHLRRREIGHLHNHIAKASCTVAMLASEISAIPYSFTLHGPDIFYEPHRWHLDEKIARAAFTACISHFCRAQAMVFAAPRHWPRLHLVHCGIEPERYHSAPRHEPPEILFVGRLAAVKGLRILFAALARLRSDHPGLRVTLIGDGPERAALEAEAAQMGLSDMVHFAGYQSQDAVARALQTVPLLVLPSFAEGVPVVLMEAMAAKCAVIATRIAGIPELVEHGKSGLLVPPGDAGALAGAMERLLSDPALRGRLGEAGQAHVIKAFNMRIEAGKLARLFRQSIAGGTE